MSFRDEYKEAFRDIVPDEEFVDELAGKMKREQGRKGKPHRKALAAAACLCMVVLIGLAVHIRNKGTELSEPLQVNTGSTLVDPTSKPNLFGISKWYQEGDSPEKIFSDFLQRLQDADEPTKVYENTENQFSDAMLLSEEEIRELSERLGAAEPVEEKPEEAGQKNYYMAEFENGDIIKFIVYEDGFFCFQDLDVVYKFAP